MYFLNLSPLFCLHWTICFGCFINPDEQYYRCRTIVVVKLSACGERDPGFDLQSRGYDFRHLLSSASNSRGEPWGLRRE